MNNSNRLSFCYITNITNNITEVKIDEDIIVDETMVDEYHSWLTQHHSGAFGVLVDKTNHYSYTFEAQLKLGQVENIQAIAILVKDHSAEVATQALMGIKQRRQIPNNIFYQREEALEWLQNQLSQ
ncbi:MAG: hypothetical protein KAT25_11040 [Sulfuriflexus sp.]|nr:hypothetical protein [Sulfuriflexus sp.]